MKKQFFIYFVLFLVSFGNSLTSLFNSEPMMSLHVKQTAEEIKKLLDDKILPSEVYIPYMTIEANDIPVQYLRGLTLQDCTLLGFNFDEFNLSEINFIDTQLKNCNLKKAIIWEVLTYSDVLWLTKNQPLELIKIYTDLIKKSNNCYSILDYKQNEYYYKKADRFYQTLKTINCSYMLEELKNKLEMVLADSIEQHDMHKIKNFRSLLVYRLNTITYQHNK